MNSLTAPCGICVFDAIVVVVLLLLPSLRFDSTDVNDTIDDDNDIGVATVTARLQLDVRVDDGIVVVVQMITLSFGCLPFVVVILLLLLLVVVIES